MIKDTIRARAVLTEKIDDLHKIAKALLVYETLSGDEIERFNLIKDKKPTRSNLRAIPKDKDAQRNFCFRNYRFKTQAYSSIKHL